METIQGVVEQFTYLGIFAVLLLGSLGVPIPEEMAIIAPPPFATRHDATRGSYERNLGWRVSRPSSSEPGVFCGLDARYGLSGGNRRRAVR